MIKNISIDLLVPFENHPFKKRSGIEQQELTESIKENGLLVKGKPSVQMGAMQKEDFEGLIDKIKIK